MRETVHSDISVAETITTEVYHSSILYNDVVNNILPQTWSVLCDLSHLETGPSFKPATLLPGSLAEPLLMSRDESQTLHCLSNVCTHRGNLIAHESSRSRNLSCGYHGRCFQLDGKLRHMPEFETAQNFPRSEDHLPKVPFQKWGPLVFASLDPNLDFKKIIQPIEDKVGFLPIDHFKYTQEDSRDFEVRANWALYCENYLEGFHIPYVHKSLATTLNANAYRTELNHSGTLQVGIANDKEIHFDLPEDHPDFGQKVAAYYFWIFPTTMLNFYPWGLSLNQVEPLSPNRTRVRFRSYVWKPELRADGAGGDLDRVEKEDEEIVEQVQKGVSSRLYRHGRYSPSQETGVHHFHRMLAQWLKLDQNS